jgi:hypothetical protein
MGGGGQADVYARVAQAPLDEGLPPGGDPEGTQRPQLGRAGRPAHQLPVAERAHEQDAEAELAGQRQDRPLGLALGRVAGHLDSVDAAGGHELGEVAEGDATQIRNDSARLAPAMPRWLVARRSSCSAPLDPILGVTDWLHKGAAGRCINS